MGFQGRAEFLSTLTLVVQSTATLTGTGFSSEGSAAVAVAFSDPT